MVESMSKFEGSREIFVIILYTRNVAAITVFDVLSVICCQILPATSNTSQSFFLSCISKLFELPPTNDISSSSSSKPKSSASSPLLSFMRC